MSSFRPTHHYLILIALATSVLGCASTGSSLSDAELRTRSNELAHEFIIVDGHIDIPYRMDEFWEDISQETIGGDFDYPRAVQGGIDAPFMSIYIPASYQETGGAKEKADSLINMVEAFANQWPDKFAIAYTVRDVRTHHHDGLISLPMGMENGAPIGEDLSLLDYFYDRGIRYITLAHSRANAISDSSYDSTRVWNGLSPFGEDVVQRMNDIGMIVDVSHISDSAFYDVMRISTAPVMATHSSARRFTPGWERNMNDDMLELLAEKDGVIMISFGSSFLRTGYDAIGDSINAALRDQMEEAGLQPGTREAVLWFEEHRKANPVGTIDDVVMHIKHVVDLVGIDHVGLGSDYDGVFSLPSGLQDVSTYPDLVFELLAEGYSDEDIRKILGENALRVWNAVEAAASD
jgi:membrane dipeptidase